MDVAGEKACGRRQLQSGRDDMWLFTGQFQFLLLGCFPAAVHRGNDVTLRGPHSAQSLSTISLTSPSISTSLSYAWTVRSSNG